MASELGASSKNLLARLRKIEGQARGIQRMIEEGRDCEEIIIQLTALKAAVSRACAAAVSGHLEECLLSEGRGESIKDTLARASKMFMKITD